MQVWTEMDYRLDICRVTKGAHIESLLGRKNFDLLPTFWYKYFWKR
jgi:hypothetical protein